MGHGRPWIDQWCVPAHLLLLSQQVVQASDRQIEAHHFQGLAKLYQHPKLRTHTMISS